MAELVVAKMAMVATVNAKNNTIYMNSISFDHYMKQHKIIGLKFICYILLSVQQ